jgi:hypothetical protein
MILLLLIELSLVVSTDILVGISFCLVILTCFFYARFLPSVSMRLSQSVMQAIESHPDNIGYFEKRNQVSVWNLLDEIAINKQKVVLLESEKSQILGLFRDTVGGESQLSHVIWSYLIPLIDTSIDCSIPRTS